MFVSVFLQAATKKQKYEKISEKKLSTAVESLCKGFPSEFAMYFNYCKGLRFEETPDYMYLRQLFRILFRTLNHQMDYTFDWTLLKQRTSSGPMAACPAGPSAAGLGLSATPGGAALGATGGVSNVVLPPGAPLTAAAGASGATKKTAGY